MLTRVAPALLLLAAAVLGGCAGPAGNDSEGEAWTTPPPLAARIVWEATFPAEEPSLSSPILHDADGDGTLDVIAGNGVGYADVADPGAGALAAFSGVDGARLWTNASGAIDASPAIGDATGDGRADAIVGLRDRRALLLFDPATGAPTATLPLANWVHSSALADVDGDGALDAILIAAGDDAPTGGKGRPGDALAVRAKGGALEVLWRAPIGNEAYSSPAVARVGERLLALHGVGGQLEGAGAFHARDAATGALVWSEPTTKGVLSSPVLADLDGDGALDVAFTEWWGAVHARRASDGAKLWDASTGHLVWTSPALADVSGDGRPDVIVTGYRTANLTFDRFDQDVNGKHSLAAGVAGLVAAFDGPTGRELWKRDVNGTAGPPVVADVTGDGKPDVLVATAHGTRGYFGEQGGTLLVIEGATGAIAGGIGLPGGVVSTPAVGDADRDGRADVALTTVRASRVVLVEMDAVSGFDAAPAWLRWRGNERGTGTAS